MRMMHALTFLESFSIVAKNAQIEQIILHALPRKPKTLEMHTKLAQI